MKKITVFIKGSSKTIDMQQSIITTNNDYIYVKKVYIFWEYENANTELTAMTINSTSVKMYPGYYTFGEIQKFFTNGCTLSQRKFDGKCTLTTNSSAKVVIPANLAKLLGFNNDNRTFNPNTVTTSDNRVNINNSLKYINIKCNIVDNANNINENGKKGDTIVSLPITTTQSLFGSVQNFTDIESKIKIDKGVINQLLFNVTEQDGNSINVGGILLDCYLV